MPEFIQGLKDSFATVFQEWLLRRTEHGLADGLILQPQRWPRFLRHVEARSEDGWLADVEAEGERLFDQGIGLDQGLGALDEELGLLQEALYARGLVRVHQELRSVRSHGSQALVRGYVHAQRRQAEERALKATREEYAARLERLEKRLAELLTLSELTGLVSTNLSLKETLDTVARLACRLVGTERASIALRVPGEDYMILDPTMGHVGTPEEFLKAWRLKLDEGVGGFAFQNQEPVVVEDAARDPRFNHQLSREEGVESWIVAPLVARGESIGLLYALNTFPTPFTAEQVHTITTLANQSAIAIENARLFEDLKRAHQALEAWAQELEQRVEERTRELRQAQAQLLQAERRAAIGQLGAGVAHELRNPLGVIRNSAFYVRSKLPRADERVAKHLGIMEREIERSGRIIGALMDFSRSPSPQIQPEDLNQAVEEALQRAPLHEGITVRRRLDAAEPVPMDREQLVEALGRVLLNALQAMPQGGELTVGTANGDGYALVEIVDQGEGIAAENVRRVFEPLWTTKTQGIGLGLPIARAAIEAQGGEIALESRQGRGTRVRVRMPLQSPEQAPSGDAQSGPRKRPAGGAQGGPRERPAGDAQSGSRKRPAGDAQSGSRKRPVGGAQGGPRKRPAGDAQGGPRKTAGGHGP